PDKPVVTQSLGTLASSFAKQPFVRSAGLVYLSSAFWMHAASTAASGFPLFFPSQPRMAFARLVTHLSCPEVHLLRVEGGAVGSRRCLNSAGLPVWPAWVRIESESPNVRQGVAEVGEYFVSSFAKHPLVGSRPPVYLPFTLSMHCGNLIGSGFALSLL